MHLLEGNISIIDCIDDQSACDREAVCPTREAWGGLQKVINGYLETITLADLVESFRKRQTKEHMYFI